MPSALRVPEAYVIPLRDDNKPAESFVVAATWWLPETDALHSWLPAIANFTGHDIPYRADEVKHVRLDASGLANLPSRLFARDMLAAAPWVQFTAEEFLATFRQQYGPNGHSGPLFGSTFFIREGPGNDVVGGVPEGVNAIWRNARATILIDLDDTFRQHAAKSLLALISPFNTAAAVYGTEASILANRGHRWDAKRGDFLSSDETLARFQAERVSALDELGSAFFRVAIHSTRMLLARPEIASRAEQNEQTRLQQYLDDRRANLSLALAAKFSDAVGSMVSHILRSPPRVPIPRPPQPTPEPPHRWAEEFGAFYRELIRSLQAALNDETTRDYLMDPAWRQLMEFEHETFDDTNTPAAPETDPEDPRNREFEEFLVEKYGRELLRRAHWTLAEMRVLVGMWSNEFETIEEWAIHNGLNPVTVRAHRHNAKLKLEAAKKII